MWEGAGIRNLNIVTDDANTVIEDDWGTVINIP